MVEYALFFSLQPDITGPGVDILAASVNFLGTGTGEYSILSGTSMSSPHIAGCGALLKSLHPEWTPGQIQSAIMFTAESTVTENGNPVGFYGAGAGYANCAKAADASLFLDETTENFLAAEDQSPSSLNVPSVVATCNTGIECSQFQRTFTSSGPGQW